MLIFILSLILLSFVILSIFLSKLTFDSKYWLTSPIVISAAYFLAVSYPGIIIASIENSSISSNILISHILWFAGVITSLLFIGIINTRKRSKLNNNITLTSGNITIFYFFIIIGILSVIFTFTMLGRIPLLYAFSSLFETSNSLGMHEARQLNTLNHKSADTIYFGQGYLRQIYSVISPIFCVALFFKNEFSNNRKKINLFLFFLFTLFGALNGQIWLSVQIMLYFIIAYIFTKQFINKNKNLAYKSILNSIKIYCILIFFIFSYRYIQYIQGREFENFFIDTLNRIYGYGSAKLFEIFPNQQQFRWGSTWLNDLSGFLPGSIESFAYEVHYLIHGGAWGFTLSPGIIASSYVNFGTYGVFIAAILITLLYTFFYLTFTINPTPLKLALAIYISCNFALGIPGDIGTYFITLLTAFSVAITYKCLDIFSKKKKYNSISNLA